MQQQVVNKGQGGFTLVELSIVLVIIGLIVGGVLVGQALIEAARVRAAMSQIDGFNAAINTFRAKFNSLPGDLPDALAGDYGLAAGGGNGNGVIDDCGTDCGTTPNANAFADDNELGVVWQHLSQQNLINGSYGTGTTIGTGFPAFRVGQGGVQLGSVGAQNFYRIAAFTSASDYGDIILPAVAFQMDTKFDDGQPNVGVVQAQGPTDFVDDAPVATCTTGTTDADAYLVGSDTGACGLRIRVSG